MSGHDPLRDVTAVVVNWNQPELTSDCIKALVADGLPDDRVVLVENGSSPDSVNLLKERFPAASFLQLEANIGYARAANAGAATQDARVYVFVNNDAFLDAAGSLERLVSAVERPGIGIAVPRLRYPDGTPQPNAVPLLTPGASFALAIGASRVMPKRLRPRLSMHWDHGESKEIPAAKGTVLAIRSALWTDLGGWVEADWMYGEDLDLSWRAKNLGWGTWFEHDALFVHLSNSSGYGRAERVARAAVATKHVIERNLPPRKARASLVAFSLGHALRAVVFTALGRRTSARYAAIAARGYWPRQPSEGLR